LAIKCELTREGSLKVRSGVDSFEEANRETDSTSYTSC
jgi:hypothetical protein